MREKKENAKSDKKGEYSMDESIFSCAGESRLIDEWVEEFKDLYFKHDKNRTPKEIWLATMGHCSAMGEAIRRDHYTALLEAASHAFCWICSYITKCNETDNLIFKIDASFSEIIGFKYPQICGHCKQAECRCRPIEIDEKKDKAAQYRELYNYWKNLNFSKHDINEWLKWFWKIYKGQIHLLTLESIGFHFLEEVGEEAMAIRQLSQLNSVTDEGIEGVDDKYLNKIITIDGILDEYEKCLSISKEKDSSIKKPKVEYTSKNPDSIKARIVTAKMAQFIEIADAFSWFCAILIKLIELFYNLKIKVIDYNFETILQNEYGKKGNSLICPRCKNPDCSCLFFP